MPFSVDYSGTLHIDSVHIFAYDGNSSANPECAVRAIDHLGTQYYFFQASANLGGGEKTLKATIDKNVIGTLHMACSFTAKGDGGIGPDTYRLYH